MATDRLALRRFGADDADRLFALDADPEVMRFITGGAATPMDVVRERILPLFLSRDPACALFGFWAVEEHGEFLGWVSYRPTRGDEAVELGYRLGRAGWGRGIATEAARHLIDAGFRDHGIERVFATTYEDNAASRRVMEKLGMRFVRSYRLTPADLAANDTSANDAGDVWDGDDVEYALTREEWLAQGAATR